MLNCNSLLEKFTHVCMCVHQYTSFAGEDASPSVVVERLFTFEAFSGFAEKARIAGLGAWENKM